MYKEHKVVMLPTEKESYICFIKDKNKLLFDRDSNPVQIPNQNNVINQHLYILSDEEIKEGDWVYSYKYNKIYFYKTQDIQEQELYKVIASTNESLELPRPSDSFIKKYCELGGIDEVMVEYETIQTTNREDYKYSNSTSNINYKTITKIASDNTITIKPVKDSWSREEVRELCADAFYKGKTDPNYPFDKWIEENL